MQLSVLIKELEEIKDKEGDMQVFVTPQLSGEQYDINVVTFDNENFCTSVEVVRT